MKKLSVKKKAKNSCELHCDCFANKHKKCSILRNSTFKENSCPFYKSKAEFDYALMKAECKVYEIKHSL